MFEYDYPLTRAASTINEGRMGRERLKLAQMQQEKEQLALDEARNRSEGLKAARTAFASVPSKTVTQDVAGSDVGPGAPVANPDYNANPRASLYNGMVNSNARRGIGEDAALFQKPEAQPQFIEGPQPQMVQRQVQQEPAMQDRNAAAVQELMKHGLISDATQLISMDDAVSQLAAKGDAREYYKRKQDLDNYKQFIAEVTPMLKTPQGRLVAQRVAQKYQAAFPDHSGEYNIDTIQVSPSGLVAQDILDSQGNVVGRSAVLEDGTVHLIQNKPDQEALLDKRFKQQIDLERMRIDAADRRAERLASAKENKPDGTVVREAVKDLPKLRREANSAAAAKSRIEQMQGLLANGAGGISGNILAKVSSVLDIPATSEADLFKKLASAGAGQLRASIIGPGPVSNYEQQLLQSVSGGGNGARSAIKKLLDYYQTEADRTINSYNDALDGAEAVAPSATKAFKPVGRKGSSGGKGAKNDPLGIL